MPLFDEITNCIELKKELLSLSDNLADKYKTIHTNESIAELSSADSLNNTSALISEKRNLEELVISTKPYAAWNTDVIDSVTALLLQAIETANEINTLKNDLLEVYEPTVFELDYNAILGQNQNRIHLVYKGFQKRIQTGQKSNTTSS